MGESDFKESKTPRGVVQKLSAWEVVKEKAMEDVGKESRRDTGDFEVVNMVAESKGKSFLKKHLKM